MKSTTLLRGICWNHSRGYLPMIATAQRFSELHPGVDIHWEKRSLQEFADYALDKLITQYDLLVIDHPWVGYAAAHQLLVPLDVYVSENFLNEQTAESVGVSHASYQYNDHQWALAIDAAAPVASYRPDLMENHHWSPPGTWDELLDLAAEGVVIMSGLPIDVLMKFYMICLAQDTTLFQSKEVVVNEDTGVQALRDLHELMTLVSRDCLHWNPITVYEQMTTTDQFYYCPFAYGYSNYSRPGYSHKPLIFTEVPAYKNSHLPVTVLGGAGLALSSHSQQREVAKEYMQFITHRVCQRTLYFDSGGQPAHQTAWQDAFINQRCANFFLNTFSTLERAYLRPRYSGYIEFQDKAGILIHDYLLKRSSEQQIIQRLNALYRSTYHENQPPD